MDYRNHVFLSQILRSIVCLQPMEAWICCQATYCSVGMEPETQLLPQCAYLGTRNPVTTYTAQLNEPIGFSTNDFCFSYLF
jgi:hypothetical protein